MSTKRSKIKKTEEWVKKQKAHQRRYATEGLRETEETMAYPEIFKGKGKRPRTKLEAQVRKAAYKKTLRTTGGTPKPPKQGRLEALGTLLKDVAGLGTKIKEKLGAFKGLGE